MFHSCGIRGNNSENIEKCAHSEHSFTHSSDMLWTLSCTRHCVSCWENSLLSLKTGDPVFVVLSYGTGLIFICLHRERITRGQGKPAERSDWLQAFRGRQLATLTRWCHEMERREWIWDLLWCVKDLEFWFLFFDLSQKKLSPKLQRVWKNCKSI